MDDTPRLWIRRIVLTQFRSYSAATFEAGPEPVVLVGANGAGKTNMLEAVSLLAPGNGLRRTPYEELARWPGTEGWTVAADVETPRGPVQIGTGLRPASTAQVAAGRLVRIDGSIVGPRALAEHTEMVWLTPAMDGLFAGPAAERRRFLDRLVLCFDPSFASRSSRFDRAMRQRNRLLAEGGQANALFEGLEISMAEYGTAIAAARAESVAQLAATFRERRNRDPSSPFPWAEVALEGTLETALRQRPAIEVEDDYREALRRGRERDRQAGRALEGPHRTDFVVTHGPNAMPARQCSTGEQKALLVGLVLAHAELLSKRALAAPPILLLDEIAAHLDALRRAALFAEILHIGSQAWMTGTDEMAFSALSGKARFGRVEGGAVVLL